VSDATYSAHLAFAHRFDVEAYGGFFDRMGVSYACDGGPERNLARWDSRDPSPTAWSHASFEVSECLGGSLQVAFDFNTVDAIDNAHGGWAVDDITVTAGPASL
jgi:hypothetical protein